MKKYRCAIFDMDGTILNTLDDLADSTNATLAALGYPIRTRDEVRRFVGNGTKLLIKRALPEGTDDDTVEAVHQQFNAYYGAHCEIKTKPYPGIEAMLKVLGDNGIKTAVVSNKPDFAVKKLAEQYFPGQFDIAVGENEAAGIRKKPAPDSVNAVIDALGVPREDCVYIGDSDVDYQTAENAGLAHILVTWGFRDKDFLIAHGGKRFVDAPANLLDYFDLKS